MRSTNTPFRSNFYLWNGVSAIFFSNYVTNVHSHNTLQIVSDLQMQFRCRIADSAPVHLSESRLSALFKQHIGIPIYRYILWSKIRFSINRIMTGQPIDDAACDASPLDFETTVYNEYMQIEKIYK